MSDANRSSGEIVKFPYSASRRVAARRPRRSKNGTPEERAAKVATLAGTSARIVELKAVGVVKPKLRVRVTSNEPRGTLPPALTVGEAVDLYQSLNERDRRKVSDAIRRDMAADYKEKEKPAPKLNIVDDEKNDPTGRGIGGWCNHDQHRIKPIASKDPLPNRPPDRRSGQAESRDDGAIWHPRHRRQLAAHPYDRVAVVL
jgi:hypothetical protein